ncbi:hypothetical protein LA080_003986 [Diaporthe eres]|nr:hypothetical protein LA080_003986 [Diaporthe eres]
MASPEIAMTNGGFSRRIACKVRCGGEQPACEKCRQAGEECVYLPTQKPSKAELAQTVEALQRRLGEVLVHIRAARSTNHWAAEEEFMLTNSLMLGHVQDEAEAYIVRLKTSSNCTTLTSPSAHNLETPNAIADNNLEKTIHVSSDAFEGLNSNSIDPGNTFDSSNNQQGLHTSGPGSREQSQPLLNLQNLFPIDEYMNIDSPNLDFYTRNGFSPQGGIDEATGAAILEPVTKFSSAIFQTQAETLVMASVVADYIAWLRKAPPGGGIPTATESPVYLGMLDNLEIRLRELCEMSRSRSTDALKELVAALGAIAPPGGSMAERLGSLEEDLQKEAQERAEVFRSRYNPCALLSQQSRDTSQ